MTALVAILFVAAAAIGIFSTSQFCGICHEMSGDIASLGESAHAKLTCYACHQSLSVPNLLLHKVLAMKEVYYHFTDFEKPINGHSHVATSGGITNDNCEFCHSILTRKVTPSHGVLIDHKVHLDKGVQCIYCHNRVAHPNGEALGAEYEDFMTMEGCARCHKQEESSKAPGRCSACHPKGFELKPENHFAKGFFVRDARGQVVSAKGHAELKKEDPKYCEMCHNERRFCDDCHGMEMPHPANWTKVHNKLGKSKPKSCAMCHKGGETFCNKCHHGAVYKSKTQWIADHQFTVKKKGAVDCFRCHEETFCSHCHVRGIKR